MADEVEILTQDLMSLIPLACSDVALLRAEALVAQARRTTPVDPSPELLRTLLLSATAHLASEPGRAQYSPRTPPESYRVVAQAGRVLLGLDAATAHLDATTRYQHVAELFGRTDAKSAERRRVWILQELSRAIISIAGQPSALIHQTLPEEDVHLVREYLAALIRYAEDRPFPLYRRSLSDLYIQLRLGIFAEPGRAPIFRVRPQHGDFDSVVDANEYLTSTTKCLVIGRPGSGKSWLLTRHAMTLARRALQHFDSRQSGPPPHLPVLASLSLPHQFSDPSGLDLGETAWIIVDGAVDLVTDYLGSDTIGASDWRQRLKVALHTMLIGDHRKGVALLDTFTDNSDERTTQRLLRLVHRLPASAIIAMRQAPTEGVPGYNTGYILDFDDNEVHQYIGSYWPSGDARQRIVNKHFDDRPLKRILRVPLFLSLFCAAADEQDMDHPAPVGLFFERAVLGMLKSGCDQLDIPRDAASLDSQVKVLEALAIFVFEAGQVESAAINRSDLLSVIDKSAVGAEENLLARDIERVASAGGLLQPTQVLGDHGYRFVHAAFVEYLFARHLARKDVALQERALRTHGFVSTRLAGIVPLLGARLVHLDAIDNLSPPNSRVHLLLVSLAFSEADPFGQLLFQAANIVVACGERHVAPTVLHRIVTRLRAMLFSVDDRMRQDAADILAQIGARGAAIVTSGLSGGIPPLSLRALLVASGRHHVVGAVDAIARIAMDDETPPLVRLDAVAALEEYSAGAVPLAHLMALIGVAPLRGITAHRLVPRLRQYGETGLESLANLAVDGGRPYCLRQAALHELRTAGSLAIIQEVAERQETPPEVRLTALVHLQAVPEAKELLKSLVASPEEEPLIRYYAGNGIVFSGEEEARDLLGIVGAGDPEGLVVAGVLSGIGNSAFSGRDRLLAESYIDGIPSICKFTIAKWLPECDALAVELLDQLVRDRGVSAWLRGYALEELTRRDLPRSSLLAVGIASDFSEWPEFGSYALEYLGRRNDAAHHGILESFANMSQLPAQYRVRAADGLLRLGDQSGVLVLLEILKDGQYDEREHGLAHEALASWDVDSMGGLEETVLDALTEQALAADVSESMRVAALRMLSALKHPEVYELLKSVAIDATVPVNVRMGSSELLGRIAGPAQLTAAIDSVLGEVRGNPDDIVPYFLIRNMCMSGKAAVLMDVDLSRRIGRLTQAVGRYAVPDSTDWFVVDSDPFARSIERLFVQIALQTDQGPEHPCELPHLAMMLRTDITGPVAQEQPDLSE